MQTQTLPFGKHKRQPLETIPAEYLAWFCHAVKTSPSILDAVAHELERRGIDPPMRPPYRPPACPHHPAAGLACRWVEDRLGRFHVKATCPTCGRFLAFMPVEPPWSDAANATDEEATWPP
jgi:uncharacterized protein (DUF3820 family)